MQSQVSTSGVYVHPDACMSKMHSICITFFFGGLSLFTIYLPFNIVLIIEIYYVSSVHPRVFTAFVAWLAQDAFSALMFSELDFECPPWPQLSADAKDFVQHLLVKDPSKRASALEALEHR